MANLGDASVDDALDIGCQRRPAGPPSWTCLTLDEPLHIAAFPRGMGAAEA
jgi:hypothetical protein